MKKDCTHLRLVPTVEEHEARMEMYQQQEIQTSHMTSNARERINQMRGCLEAEIILPNGKFQYFKPRTTDKKEAAHEIALYVEGLQAAKEGYVVLWRFIGQQSFYHGTKIVAEPKFRKMLRKLKDYFFDYQEVYYETEQPK